MNHLQWSRLRLCKTWLRPGAGSRAARAIMVVSQYDLHDLAETRRHLAQWLQRWQSTHRKLCDWVEANIEESAGRCAAWPGA